MADNKINVGGRLHSIATGNVLAGANEIFDDEKNKKQNDINTETYSLVNNINERLNSLSPDQQSALNVATKATNNETKLGYYVCDTEGNLAAKVISDATGYILSKGGSMKVKMTNANTANNATLNINSTGAKALYYAGERVTSNNSWGAGETVEVYYDGTSYYSNSVAGGSSDGVFDVSIKYPTSGVEGGNTYTLEGALLVLNTNLPSSKKKGGMSIKFIQSSDNKYVQYRLTANEWSTNTDDWSFCGDNVLTYNPEYIEAKTDSEYRIIEGIKTDGTKEINIPTTFKEDVTVEGEIINEDLTSKLASKVDKVTGKSLIDADFASSQEVSESDKWLLAVVDSDRKIAEGIKKTGIKQIEIPVKLNNSLSVEKNIEAKRNIDFASSSLGSIASSEYISAETDAEGKVISGIRKDGTKEQNTTVSFRGNKVGTEELEDYIEVKTDSEYKLLEGIHKDGKKHISEFDDETLAYISSKIRGTFSIPLLDANFDTPIPYTVIGTKGSASAQYKFQLPLGDSWNVRVKFRITEDILNTNKTAVIASLNSAEVIAKPIPLAQCVTDITLGTYSMHNAWSATEGGICYNCNSISNWKQKKNIGKQAISVKYTGNGTKVTLANDGNGLILDVDGVETVYSFTTYPTMDELHAALSANSDLEVVAIALNCHNSTELAKFTAVDLVATIEGNNNQGYEPPVITYTDKAPFYLHYSMDDVWHQIEIVSIGEKIYSTCDGNIVEYNVSSNTNELILGGYCDVLFKDFVVDSCTPNDAEIVTYSSEKYIISSVNPYIVIFEGHEVVDFPAYEAEDYPSIPFNLGTETLAWVFKVLKEKGYEAVSIDDVSDYFTSGKTLPKRCYVMIFDDYRWNIALNPRLKSVFGDNGAKPCLAIVTGRGYPKIDDGTTDNPTYQQIYHSEYVSGVKVNTQITEVEASAMARNANFSLCTHTKDHRSTYAVAPSDRIAVVEKDILDADKFNVNGLVYVYPGGNNDPYMHEVLEYMGVKLGIEIMSGPLYNNILRSRYALSRINISKAYRDGAKLDYKNNVLKRVL